jgi:hypothetical protein
VIALDGPVKDVGFCGGQSANGHERKMSQWAVRSQPNLTVHVLVPLFGRKVEEVEKKKPSPKDA